MEQLLKVLEMRNGILEQWQDLYEEFDPVDDSMTTRLAVLKAAYDRLDDQMGREFGSLVGDGGWLLRTKGPMGPRLLEEERRREKLIRELAKKNQAYMDQLGRFRGNLEAKLKDVQKRKQMSKGYRISAARDAAYVDEKR